MLPSSTQPQPIFLHTCLTWWRWDGWQRFPGAGGVPVLRAWRRCPLCLPAPSPPELQGHSQTPVLAPSNLSSVTQGFSDPSQTPPQLCPLENHRVPMSCPCVNTSPFVRNKPLIQTCVVFIFEHGFFLIFFFFPLSGAVQLDLRLDREMFIQRVKADE